LSHGGSLKIKWFWYCHVMLCLVHFSYRTQVR
jgi:hypothetical protein